MKSYTDIEQSRKLAGILPIESADMCFNTHGNMPPLMTPYTRFKEFFNMEPTPNFLIPCWSLAALLEQFEDTAGLAKDYGLWFCYDNRKSYCTKHYDNPVDACVEMILTLNEQKLI